MRVLLVPQRYCGPPGSGNGGWTAGALAAHLPDADAVTVTLRRPPPLELAMPVEPDGAALVARLGDVVVAEAVTTADELAPVDAVDADTARAAQTAYAGLRAHPFPTCFACGTGREPGDGLRIFPGFVAAARVAATWTPDAGVEDEAAPGHATLPVTWAALDCVGGWAADVAERPMVLGRMTAAVDAAPRLAETHVVVGEVRRADGRKTFTASTLYDPDGRVVARAEHVWLTIDPATFPDPS